MPKTPEAVVERALTALAGANDAPTELQSRATRIAFHGQSLFPLYRAELENGLALAAKVVRSERMARTEARGLQALGEAGAPAPRVYGWHTDKAAGRAVILMEFLESAGGRRAGAAQLREDLFRLYSGKRERYGWDEDNFIGTLPQPNGDYDRFADFWSETRIAPQLRVAVQNQLLDANLYDRLERIIERRSEEWGLNAVAPRLIHGDLWSGNLLPGPGGRTYLIDPSVACGNPEQDFAMLALFGGPLSAAELGRLGEEVGLPPGYPDRIAFWQIYPILVHVNIFGSSYAGQLERAVRACE